MIGLTYRKQKNTLNFATYTAQNMIRVKIYPVCHLYNDGFRIALIILIDFHYLRGKRKRFFYM